MSYAVICVVALLSSALTLFSGFGLGTILMPFFAIFFPVEVAVAATATVHFLNNLFKLALVGRQAVWRVVALFGLPGAALSFVGAWALTAIARTQPLTSYEIGGRAFHVTLVGVVIGAMIAVFAIADLAPSLRKVDIGARWLPLGGALSGFFGGISGHQGALRAAFLSKLGLSAPEFVGTSVASACLMDIARLSVYGASFVTGHLTRVSESRIAGPVIAGTVAAFIGALVASRYTRAITAQSVRLLVGVMLLALAVVIGAGLV